VKEDFDVTDELGFEPAVSATGATPRDERPASSPSPKRRKRSLRRTVGAGMALMVALIGMGATYAAFASTSGASDTGTGTQEISAGKQLFEVSCITCHGANLQGVKDRGPSLLGVGSAAVYFQVSTGRMPATAQGAGVSRKKAKFNEDETNQLAAYVESVGGGPTLPEGTLRDQDIAEGGNLFRLNCASCHGTTFKGAPLSAGKVAPSLNDATDKQMYAAMLTGPENMPIFSDNQLTPTEKRQIVAYVQTLKASKDPGGHGLDRIGPVSEAIVIWVGGMGAIVIAILWIGAKN
jgi:ubiquinol-cytochrome c reductase cytochrome c subunit